MNDTSDSRLIVKTLLVEANVGLEISQLSGEKMLLFLVLLINRLLLPMIIHTQQIEASTLVLW